VTTSTVGAPAYRGPMRLVSLLPSATEIVYALGLGEQLVGVTFECDEPAAARLDKAVVVGGRDTSGMSPIEIDEYVRSAMAAGDDLYTLRSEALAGLNPDLILTQDLCRVCALPSGQVQDALAYLGCRSEVLSLDPHSLDDVLADIALVGERTGTAERAAALVSWSGWTRPSPPGTGFPTWSGPPAANQSGPTRGRVRCRPRGPT